MSGFEAIGVILGIYPLVVNALQAYKSAKDGRGWSLLFNDFEVEQIIYVDCIQHLLGADIPDGKLIQLTNGGESSTLLWKDPMLHASLHHRLGPERSTIVLKTLQEMDQLLKTVRDELQRHEISPETSHPKFRNTIRHMKLLQSTVKKNLELLHEYNGRLQKLLTNYTSPGFQAQGKLPKPPPKLDPEELSRISKHADELFDAIYEGYKCQCSVPHEANLGLPFPDIIDLEQPIDLLFPLSESMVETITQQDVPPSNSSGETIAGSADVISIFSKESRRWSHRGSLDTMHSSLGSPIGSPPPFRGRSISLSQNNGKSIEDGGLIEDLCHFIRKLGDGPSTATSTSCLGVLGLKEKKYKVKVTSLDGEASQAPSLVCLDDYLPPTQKWEASRKKRMDLALGLSLAILQFYKTAWLTMWWTWQDFAMLKGDKSQIFVTQKFFSTQNLLPSKPGTPTHSPSTSAFWACIGEPILTRLGFALVELALGQRLCDMRPAGTMEADEEDMLDFMTAKQLVENGRVHDEAGKCYSDIVMACLDHTIISDNGSKRLNSEKDVNFQVDVEKYIVAPIRAICEHSWGKVGVS